MDKAQSDLIEWYKLETKFFPDHVRHTRYLGEARNRNKREEEDWSNCGELGSGGFGVVYKQIRKTTGRYRAVKTIDKRPPLKLDYSRELLVMAILAKRPPLFVEFLGWFEEPEALYIAMEYLEAGDLTKHIGAPLLQETVRHISKQILEGLNVMHQQGIAHRDLKPANIFVVSMSPVWVKLGDFGVSKRILAQATTTLHTPVSTQLYSAPEVLGLDSSSETSNYTNSVDIWSLGCVIYELLAGAKLFPLEGQVSRYFFGKWPFPEDKLKGLSPPTDDIGISLLKSMLLIRPEDRPTAAGALSHGWLAGLESYGEESGDDQDQRAQSLGEGASGRRGRKQLAIHDIPKKKRRERNPITQDDTKPILGGVVLGARSQGGSHATTPKARIDGSIITQLDVVSPKNSIFQMGSLEPESMPQSYLITHSTGKGAKTLRRKQVHTIPQSHSQSSTPNPKLSSYTSIKGVANQNWMLNARPPASDPPTADPHHGNSLRSALRTNGPMEHGPKKIHQAAASDLYGTASRIAYQRTYPTRPVRGDGRGHNGPTINSMRTPKTRRNCNTRQDLDPLQTPITGWNPDRNPNILRNPNRDPNTGWNPNRNPNPS
ncbi:kinase-like domain-containing protein [Tuber borchii]|uniref:non-specific serine/threonine protein kinase n=1 Tax=Tuber borchii TaxID=42251 RepID=A0A2T6ZU61_TUBBO|nr:kinase-like domain-containing protein [Tuber borchii]